MSAYGKIKHPKRINARIGPASIKEFSIKARISRHGDGYDANLCVGDFGLKTVNGKYRNPNKCARAMKKRTPTLAVKSALVLLSNKLR